MLFNIENIYGYFMKTKFLLIVVGFISLINLCSAQKNTLPPAPNYNQKSCWLRLPEQTTKKFDVFYVHPTTYMDTKDGMNADLSNKDANAGAESAFQRQATAFKESCNIFAPRYRQGSIKILRMPEKDRMKYLSIALEDVHKAFELYLKKYNKNRPYIIASHSQGSQVVRMFLKKYKQLIKKDKLIAVYAIGYTFTPEDIKASGLKLAVKPDQLAGIIVWNTIGPKGKSPVINPSALCVNPLCWTDTKAEQPATKNIYARILMKDGSFKVIKHFTSAQIDDKGGLVIPAHSIMKQLDSAMGPEVYHGYDYDFFYGNIVENVAVRCKAWMKKNSSK